MHLDGVPEDFHALADNGRAEIVAVKNDVHLVERVTTLVRSPRFKREWQSALFKTQ